MRPNLRERIAVALGFWERGRIFYNVVLAIASAVAVDKSEMPFSVIFSGQAIAWIIAVVLANVLYCAAYPVDLLAQALGFREQWVSLGRKLLLAIGTILGAMFAYNSAYSFGRAYMT